jgi:hypothetical protein
LQFSWGFGQVRDILALISRDCNEREGTRVCGAKCATHITAAGGVLKRTSRIGQFPSCKRPLRCSPDSDDANCDLVDHEDGAKNVRLTAKQQLPQVALQLSTLGCWAAPLRM